MTTKIFFLFVSINLSFILNAQTAISWFKEDFPSDSLPAQSLNTHSGFYPMHRKIFTTEKGLSTGKNNQFIPLVDAVMQGQKNLPFRTNIGFAFEGQPWKKWYYRVGILSGYEKQDSLLNSNYYHSFGETNGIGLQPMARISYTPNHIFHFQTGIDKNFIGEGNRSLLLSDYGKAYPFAKLAANFWQIEYTVLYQFLRDEFQNKMRNKFVAAHHISWNATKELNFGLFETVIFQPKDSLLNRGFDVEYLNPMVFFRPQEYSLGSSDNVLIGASATVKLKRHTFYSQFILDEFFLVQLRARNGYWANKFGGQIGAKGIFKFIKQNFWYRLEANAVRPFTYSHLTSLQNYGNLGAVLAHPLGANFLEGIAELRWQKENVFVKVFISGGYQGLDKDDRSFGSDVYVPYTKRKGFNFGYKIGSGQKNIFARMNLHVAYKLTPKGNINAFAELQFRYDSALENNKFNFLPAIGIRSYLWNDYRNY